MMSNLFITISDTAAKEAAKFKLGLVQQRQAMVKDKEVRYLIMSQ